MRAAQEIKPEFEGKFGKLGNSYALLVPKWFANQWDLNPTKRYKVQIIEEIDGVLVTSSLDLTDHVKNFSGFIEEYPKKSLYFEKVSAF
jgi:hypothetical protein